MNSFGLRPMWMAQIYGRPCGQCGIPHDWRVCLAESAQCFKCGNTGHFARMCLTRMPRRDVSVNAITTVKKTTYTENQIPQIVVKKSEKKIKRDRERKKAFDERRRAMSLLPYSKISDDSFYLETLYKLQKADFEDEIEDLNGRIDSWRYLYKEKESKIKEMKEVIGMKDGRIQELLKENRDLKENIVRCKCSYKTKRPNSGIQTSPPISAVYGLTSGPTRNPADVVWDDRPKCHVQCRVYDTCRAAKCSRGRQNNRGSRGKTPKKKTRDEF